MLVGRLYLLGFFQGRIVMYLSFNLVNYLAKFCGKGLSVGNFVLVCFLLYLSHSHCSISSVRVVMHELLWPNIKTLFFFLCIIGHCIWSLSLDYILGL